MNQPNYNFAYNEGGLVNFVWRYALRQNPTTQNNGRGVGMVPHSGQTSGCQYGNQQQNGLFGNVDQHNKSQQCNTNINSDENKKK